MVGAETLHRDRAGLLSHFPQLLLVVEQFDGISRHRFYIPYVGEVSGLAVVDDLRHAARPGGDRNHLARHGLQRGQAKRFQFARHQHDVGDGQLLLNLILLAEKQHVLMNALLHGQPLGHGTVRSVSDEQQL